MNTVSPQNFEKITQVIKRFSGITLVPEKAYLLETRVLPVMRRYHIQDFTQLATALQKQQALVIDMPNLLYDVIEVMTINETSFCRDMRPFDHFRKVIIPELVTRYAGQKTPLRFWSAACSTGQEPYSLAMCLQESADVLGDREVDILGSDLSRAAVQKAKQAEYSQFEVQRGLPVQWLLKYCQQEGERWTIRPEIRERVQFQVMNLTQTIPAIGRFDVIFCRNVLIYFDLETKRAIVNRLAQCLRPEGILVLGGSETLVDLNIDMQPIEGMAGFYK